MSTGLYCVGISRVVIESHVVNFDVTHSRSNDSPAGSNWLRIVCLGLTDNYWVLEDCKISAEVHFPELCAWTQVLGTCEVSEDQISSKLS